MPIKDLRFLKNLTQELKFYLSSHDLDMRGSGNIIGDAQSGHIREVKLELYHKLLKIRYWN